MLYCRRDRAERAFLRSLCGSGNTHTGRSLDISRSSWSRVPKDSAPGRRLLVRRHKAAALRRSAFSRNRRKCAGRRDLLDHVIVLNEWHLKRMMNEYSSNSHEARAYQLPGGARPRRIQIQDVGLCRCQSSAASTIATTSLPELPSRLIQTKLGSCVSDGLRSTVLDCLGLRICLSTLYSGRSSCISVFTGLQLSIILASRSNFGEG
jgi:hypothetical protein